MRGSGFADPESSFLDGAAGAPLQAAQNRFVGGRPPVRLKPTTLIISTSY
jgi:hypothetical protein